MSDRTSGDDTWLDCCEAFARREGIATDFLAILHAFDRPWPRGGPAVPNEQSFAGSFDDFETQLLADEPWPLVTETLTGEVDANQAAMMARRARAVDTLLSSMKGAKARLLRVGMRHRLKCMLEGSAPRVLRIRALADFYYSHGGRVAHQKDSRRAPSLSGHVTTMTWDETSPGIQFGRIAGPSTLGPLHINILKIDLAQVRLSVVDCRPWIEAGDGFEAYVRRTRVDAAVSGGFFLYSESPIESPSMRYDPVGLLLSDGAVLSPPIFRRGSLLVSEDGGVAIRTVGLKDITIEGPNGRSITIDAHAHGARSTALEGDDAVAIVGDRVVATGQHLTPPLNGFLLPMPADRPWAVGSKVHYRPPRLEPGGPYAQEGISGGPLLVQNGEVTVDLRAEDFWGNAPPVTFSQDETGDENLLPRLAAGLDGDGRLILAAIDGRDLGRALGLTLKTTGELMQALGCHVATNLDGGSSKRMMVAGETVDLASTEVHGGLRTHRSGDPSRTRPVRSGLIIQRRQ
jgi:hypothetical protein